MNPDPTPDPLSRALQRWQLRPRRNRNFRDEVWQRIDRSAQQTWADYVRGHLVGWSVTAMLALLLAGWGGRAMARAELEAKRNEMVVSYLNGLDPRVMAGIGP